MSRVVCALSMGLNPRAECTDDVCDWERDYSSSARDMAKLHAKATGHDVLVVTEKRYLYRLEDATATTQGD